MSESIYTRVLAQLVAKEGGTHAVAKLLHVPEKTLQRWMHGSAQMPLQAFLRALEIVVEHERATGPLQPAEAPPEGLVFKAGAVLAQCARCSAHEFRRADPAAPHTYMSVLACLECGTRAVHHELVAELAKEVARRAGSYGSNARKSRSA